MATYSIGQLAEAAGVHLDTVRYYERRGLLPEPPRTASGYRQYGEADVARLDFIRRAKALGFTLREVGDLLAGTDGGPDQVLATAAARLAEVEQQQRELTMVRTRLQALVQTCETGDAADCVALLPNPGP